MTAYVANHRKKARIFRKREEELRHAIGHGYSQERIFKAAERLREAKFAVFKSEFSQHSVLPASEFSLEEAAERNPLVGKWLAMTAEDIVAEYSKSAKSA